jgi:predicted alpha/beta-hydrolase family hydrolase
LSDVLHISNARDPSMSEPKPLSIAVGDTEVSALLDVPEGARSCYVMAHGAGAGMAHPFMTAFAADLGARSIATLRYQFPYMERGSRRPDPPRIAHAAVRAAVAEASRRLPRLALYAGGRSFGGRMTSQAQAASPLPGVRGLAFVAFPLHPAGEPADARGEHLAAVQIPMLFLQGTRDELAHLSLLQALVARLGSRATLELLAEADHSFHVPARTGRNDADVRAQAADALARWVAAIEGQLKAAPPT